MKEFGWTIEYVLSLSYPVFLDLFHLIKRCRYDSAIDEFYTPYAAVKYGGKPSKHLFSVRGDIFVGFAGAETAEQCTPEMIKSADEKLRKIIENRQKKLEKAIS